MIKSMINKDKIIEGERIKLPTFKINGDCNSKLSHMRTRRFGLQQHRFTINVCYSDYMDILDKYRRHVLYSIKNNRLINNGDIVIIKEIGDKDISREIRVDVTSVDDKFVRYVKKNKKEMKDVEERIKWIRETKDTSCCRIVDEPEEFMRERMSKKAIGTQVIGFRVRVIDDEDDDKAIFDKMNKLGRE